MICFLLAFFAAAVITYMMPKKYESKAVIQVVSSALDETQLIQPLSHVTIATADEQIGSQFILRPVVQKLELSTRWNMSEDDALGILRGIVEAQNIRDTDLIEIRVKHPNPEDARDIAMETYEAYKKRREDRERQIIESRLKEMEIAIQVQSDLVEKKRKRRDQQLSNLSPDLKVESNLAVLEQDLEIQQEMLDRMRENLVMDRINFKLPKRQVILHEEPVIAQSPSSPNVTLNMSLGAVAGVLLGMFIVLLMQLLQGPCQRCAA